MTFMKPFSDSLKNFILQTAWTFAKTMPEWPHEYLVRGKVDEKQFLALVEHIRQFGYVGSFYQKPITYFDEDEFVYWTMGAAIEITTIINRCRKENSYEARLKNGTLPGRKDI